MTISRTIWVILNISVLLWLEVIKYILHRTNLTYLRNSMAMLESFSAGRIIRIIMRQFFYKVVSIIIICKEEYIKVCRYL